MVRSEMLGTTPTTKTVSSSLPAYEILKPLSLSGNSQLCRERATGRLLVQKRFAPANEKFFTREAKMLHAVQGFSGAPLLYYAWQEKDGCGLIGREFIAGERMGALVHAPVEMAKALRIALNELHDKFGVCHGDISPNNILLRENSKNGLDAILLDWEFARAFKEESLSSYENFRGSLGFADGEKGLRERDEHAFISCLSFLALSPESLSIIEDGSNRQWWKKWI